MTADAKDKQTDSKTLPNSAFTDLVLKFAVEPIVLIGGCGEEWDVTLRDSLRRSGGELRGKVVVIVVFVE